MCGWLQFARHVTDPTDCQCADGGLVRRARHVAGVRDDADANKWTYAKYAWKSHFDHAGWVYVW